jgi:hypothetical protein
MAGSVITDPELAHLLQELLRRFDRIERSFNRVLMVVGPVQILTLVLLLLILRKTGL